MLEKDIEDVLANNIDYFFPDEGFILLSRQQMVEGKRFDLLFKDKFDRKVIIEIKRGVLSREASGQIVEYYGLLKSKSMSTSIELILVANTIPSERRMFLEMTGISCKEIPEREITRFLPVKDSVDIPKKVLKNKNNKNVLKTVDDLIDRILTIDGKLAIKYIIEQINLQHNYQGEVEQRIFYSYGIYRVDNYKKYYDYAFIVNRTNLHFYIRKPGEKYLEQNGKDRHIFEYFNIRRTNSGEITVKIDNEQDAKNICKVMFFS